MADRNQTVAGSHIMRSTLYVLGLLGTVSIWGRAAADGTLVHLFYALHGVDEYILPGAKAALRTSFTGIYWPIDYLLDVLLIFFWEAVDGSHPATSAIGIYFLGQLFPILVAFYMDSFRAGHGLGASLIKFNFPSLGDYSPLIGVIIDLPSGCNYLKCALSVPPASSGR
jgi:hypothetical protein